MSIVLGPSSFWLRTREAADYYAVRCPVAARLGDGSRIFCKTGGRAWIMAPLCTEVAGVNWAGGQYNNCLVGGERCCICEWASLCTQLITYGFNPCEWFVPNLSQVQSASSCRANWDVQGFSIWSSTECTTTTAGNLVVTLGTPCSTSAKNRGDISVRAIRCVTY